MIDSSDILEWLGDTAEGAWLYPEAQRDTIREYVRHIDVKLGVHTRRWAYQQVFESASLALPLLLHGVGPVERVLGTLSFPMVKRFVMKGLNINPKKAQESLDRVRGVFDEAAARLAGQQFLAGDTMTAADITFAAHASLVLLPPQFPVPLPELSAFNAEAEAVVKQLRKTPAGKHAMKLYAEQRHIVAPAP